MAGFPKSFNPLSLEFVEKGAEVYASRVTRRWPAQRIDCGAGRCRTTGGSLACPANRARKREGASKE